MTQIQQQLADQQRFKRMLFIDSKVHVLAQIILGLGVAFLVVIAFGWLLISLPLLLTGSSAMKMMVLKSAARVFWLLPLHPTLSIGWGRYLIWTAEVALVYCLGWRIWQGLRKRQVYQQFQRGQTHFLPAFTQPINAKYNLIYRQQTPEKFTQALKKLSTAQQAQWEKITHQANFGQQRHDNFDAQKIQLFLRTHFQDDYQFVTILLAEPAALPFYWPQGQVMQLSDTKERVYFLLNQYDAQNKRRKTTWRQYLSQLLQLAWFN